MGFKKFIILIEDRKDATIQSS